MNGFTSPRQMRAALATQINDPVFLDRMIGEYFKDHQTAELPKQAPVSGYVAMSYKEPAKPKEKRDLEEYIDMMEEGSRKLHDAIEDMRKGRAPKTSSRLIWRHLSGADAFRSEGMSIRDDGGFTYEPPIPARRGPCFKCGAAGGCVHLGGAA